MDERIPDYFADTLKGVVWKKDGVLSLSLAPLSPPADSEIVLEGDITLRYGIEMLHAPHAIVPGLFETERGAILTGRAAWDYLWSKFQLYPRAEVIGVQEDGQEVTVLMRELDFGEPAQVLAYPDEVAARAVGRIKRLHAPEGAALPALLRQALK